MRSGARTRLSILLVLLIAAVRATAATTELRVAFDVDQNVATGCGTDGGTGIDQVFVTEVTHDETTASVARTHRLVCTAGSFGDPVDVVIPGWPAALESLSGWLTVESRVALSAFGGAATPATMRVRVTARSGDTAQTIGSAPDGGALLVPPPGRRRRAVDFGEARTIVINGALDDWGMITPFAVRDLPEDDSGFQFLRAFSFTSTADGFLYFAFQANVTSGAAPTAVDDRYTRNQSQSLSVSAARGVLRNDVDPNGQPLTATKVSEPDHGTVSLNPDGSFQYTPATPSSVETDRFTYKASNGSVSSSAATVTIDVNERPDVKNGTLTIPENSPAGTVVGIVDVQDDTGDTHSFLITGGNTGGAFAVTPLPNGDGQITVANAAALNFEVNPLFVLTVRATDAGGLSDVGTITINVINQNDPPVAASSSQSVAEDQLLNVPAPGLLANASDEDGSPLTLSIVSNPSNGVVTLNPDGSYTYDSNPNYNGPDSFTWRASDGTAFSNTATVNITVTPVNDAPSFTSGGNVNSPEDTPFSAPWATAISAGPADESGQTLTFNVTVTSNAGLLSTLPSISPAGVLSFTPATNASGSATIDVTLSDSGGGTNTSGTVTFTITVTPVDDDPVAVADATTVSEDASATTINVLANDTDVDAGPKSITSVTQPTNGTVAITNAGGDLTYQPNANYCGSDTFTYTLTPGGSTATVTMTVTCVDDNPVAVADAATVNEDSGANTINVLANDTDVDAGPMSITSVTPPANGTVVITNAGADLTYTPNANYCGPDTFTYTLTPGGSSTTVTMTVTCVDDNPVAVADAATVSEDSGANTINVLANDTDLDAGPISITSVTQPANGTVVITNAGADLTYAPAANYCNNPPGTTLDTFTYTLTPGGSSTTVTVTVQCLNDGPALDLDADDSGGTTGAGYAVTFPEGDSARLIEDPVDATVADVDNTTLASMTVTLTNLLDTGFETLSATTSGTSIVANYVPATGILTLTGPDTVANFQTVLRTVRYLNTDNAPDTTPRVITFVASDGATNGNTATSTVTVVPIDSSPTAVNDSATVNEDSGANTINVLANDVDADAGPISVTSVTQPANGTVAITNAGADLTYTPNANYCNNPPGTTPDTFTYTLAPGGSTATVTVTVQCIDDNPLAVADSATVNEDSGASTINVLANDTDVDAGPISLTSVTQPTNGTVVITNAGADLTYAPNANYCGGDTFTYTLTPGGSSTTVTVTVQCIDDNPVAVADAATVNEDSGANTINVLANDTDADAGPISITSVTQPANGAVVITNAGADLTYAPNANYCGGSDTFTYTLTPGASIATVTMSVTCIDDNPVAVADAATVNEDSGANTINVLANDTDLDAGPISITSVTQPSNGTAVITNAGADLTYTPAANYCNNPPGTTLDTFTYTLSPGGSTTTVTVTVQCLNDGPALDLDADDSGGTTGADYAVTFTEGESAKLIEDAADATVADVDNTTPASMTVTLTNLLDTGFETLSANTSGTSIVANYVPATGILTLTGPDTVANFQTVLRTVRYNNTDNAPNATPRVITFVASDGATNSNTATSTVTVIGVDSNPTAVNDAATVNEDSGAITINVLANDNDADGGPISITSVTQPANGAVAITNAGADLTYTPNANYCGGNTFTYTLTPGGSTATVTVTVTCIDDNPVAVADAATVAEDSGATAVSVLANDTDADGGPISITSVTQPANGTVVITGGGTGLTYQPNANYCNNPPGTSLDTFTYTLTPGGSSTAVTMTVTCVDDNPVAVADAATVAEDSGANAVDVLANDTDVDGGPISISSVTQPANGVVVITGGGTGLTYAPNANYCNNPPGTSLDTFTYTLAPGGSSTTVTITVTCVDDPPVAVNDAATVVEDSGANAIPVLANDPDIDGGPISITSVTQPTNGTVVITGGGTGLTYAPNANYCNNPPGTTLDTFTYTLTPGGSVATVTMTVTCVNDPPVADNNTFDFIGNTDLVVDLAALATPHALETTGTTLGVLDGDSDPVEGNNIAVSAITVGACTDNSAPFDCSDPAVGRVQMQTNGRFIFTPAAGDTGATETFQYTLTDDGTPLPASTTATVTLTRFERVWYIDGDAPGGGTGTSGSPLNNFDLIDGVGGAGDPDLAGDYIFVHGGASIAASAAVPLEANQRVLGEFAGLSIPVNLNGNGSPTVLVTSGGSKPAITRAAGDLFTMVNDIPVEIRGLTLSAAGGNVVDLNSNGALTGSATLTISDNVINGAGAEGLDINLGAGTSGTLGLTISNNSWNTGGTHTGTAIDVTRTSGTLNANISNNANVLSNATGINVNGTITITGFANNTVHQNTGGSGVTITNATFDATPGGTFQTVSGGTTTIGASGNGVGTNGFVCTTCAGDLSFSSLQIFADGGAALSASSGAVYTGSAGLRIASAASGDIYTATGGPAVDLSTVTMNSITPTTITSANSPTAGVALNSVLGTFTAGSGSSITSISSGAGTAFQVGNSNAAITYNGTITNNNGKGVNLTSNTGSTIGFTGNLTLSSGPNTAFNATGGGTVTSTNTSSSLTTTTGTALTVANTTIGTGGLNFASITASGAAPNGVVLSSTTGNLTVTGNTNLGTGGGTGPTGAGISIVNHATGTISFGPVSIQRRGSTAIFIDNADGTSITFGATTIPNPNNSGGDGIHVEDSAAAVTVATATISDANQTVAQADADTNGFPDNDGDGNGVFLRDNSGLFTLNGGTISNPGNDGIDARTSRFAISGVTITNPGQDVGGATEGAGGHGISAMNMSGANTVASTTVSGFNGANRSGLVVNSNTNTMTLTVTSSAFQNSTGNTGITSLATGTSNVTLTVGQPGFGNTFTNISASALVARADTTGTINVTVQNSTFQNSPTDGKTNVTGGTTGSAVGAFTIINNSFTNVFRTASTGEAVISLNFGNSGGTNTSSANVSGNTITGVGLNSSTCAGGAAFCAGPLEAILVFVDQAADINGTLNINNNVISDVQQGGILLDIANSNGGNVDATITGNTVGTDAAPVGRGPSTSVTTQFGIEVFRRRQGGQSANVLISGNSIRNGNGTPTTLNAGIFVRGEANTTLSTTITNNNVNTLSAGPVEIRVDANSPGVSDPDASVVCADITGNTVASGAGVIDLNEVSTNTLNIEQASAAAVATANSIPAANVTPDAGVSFGVTCATPP